MLNHSNLSCAQPSFFSKSILTQRYLHASVSLDDFRFRQLSFQARVYNLRCAASPGVYVASLKTGIGNQWITGTRPMRSSQYCEAQPFKIDWV